MGVIREGAALFPDENCLVLLRKKCSSKMQREQLFIWDLCCHLALMAPVCYGLTADEASKASYAWQLFAAPTRRTSEWLWTDLPFIHFFDPANLISTESTHQLKKKTGLFGNKNSSYIRNFGSPNENEDVKDGWKSLWITASKRLHHSCFSAATTSLIFWPVRRQISMNGM